MDVCLNCHYVFSCKNDEDDVIYNELHFFDKIQIHVSRPIPFDTEIK